MRFSLHILALAATVDAHYTLSSFIYNGVTQPVWQQVRQWTGYYAYTPVLDVKSLSIRCNVDGSTKSAPSTLTVAAGSTLAYKVEPNVYHAGPELVYLAKVPAGKTAANWDGSGAVWFKIFQRGPDLSNGQISWPGLGTAVISFKLPASLPKGDYLVRGEQIGLHAASTTGGAQFYISCGQITVTGSGTGKPGPLVAFPGAYSASDPGLLINIYWPVPTVYKFPGPAVWTG